MKNKNINKGLVIGFVLIAVIAFLVSGLITFLQMIELGVTNTAHFLADPVPAYAMTNVNTSVEEKNVLYTANMSVQDKIRFYAGVYDVNVDDALRIAKCESGFRADAENINGSATGVYQFIRKTWKTYCGGDIYNADHNITCFMMHYPDNPQWWVCN